ncbi:MAG: hypothetical protein QOH79_3515, partial [Acidimicrobiaceae bacterium]
KQRLRFDSAGPGRGAFGGADAAGQAIAEAAGAARKVLDPHSE